MIDLSSFPDESPYRKLAAALDALPNRFPQAGDESDLHLLAKIFSPEEADLAANLQPELEAPDQIAARLGRDPQVTSVMLKEMVKKGLIFFGRTAQGRPGFGLMPFVVGIYEAQLGRMDAEMAGLFEKYYLEAFGKSLNVRPQVHRIIPVGETVKNNMEVRPFESVSGLIDQAQAWGVQDCICRKQKALIGEACEHPLDVCMVLSQKPGAFDNHSTIHALNHDESLQTLQRAAQAGLVHCVSNHQDNLWYICNCCTCSCGILRGMVDLGIANVVARSAFVNHVDPDLCIICGDCISACQFNALSLETDLRIQEIRCVGCGVCVPVCPQGALFLERRPDEVTPPINEAEWRAARFAARSD